MVGESPLRAARGGNLVEPPPARARQLELDEKVQRHAVGDCLLQRSAELERKVGAEDQALVGLV